MAKIFDPITIGDVTIRNRVGLSPMSMYSARDGEAEAFNAIHYGARAFGGAGLVFTGTSAVAPEGRITPGDPGLWDDGHIAAQKAIVDAIHLGGGVAGVQIGHAGRKASTSIPWRGGPPKGEGRGLAADEGGWQTIAPSAIAFGAERPHTPREMTVAEIEQTIDAFADAARRADQAGYDVLELHGGHGYLIESFHSPVTNQRTDEWGGALENRLRFPLAVIKAVRKVWPSGKPLALRFAMEDFGRAWTMEDAITFAKSAQDEGVALFDPMSFGGIAPGTEVPWTENFTARHAKQLKAALPDAVVAISAQTAPEFETTAESVEALLDDGAADIVLLGRQLLADPNWPARAAAKLGDDRLLLPNQYEHWLTWGSGAADAA